MQASVTPYQAVPMSLRSMGCGTVIRYVLSRGTWRDSIFEAVQTESRIIGWVHPWARHGSRYDRQLKL